MKQACVAFISKNQEVNMFAFIAKLKDPEARWINLLEVRYNRSLDGLDL